MKKIDAFWEKRNLGVECVEITLGMDDFLADFEDEIRALQTAYQVLKIPSGRTDMLLSAQNLGFQVIEMQIQLTRSTKDYSLPSIYKRFESHISLIESDKFETEEVLGKIRKGDLFVTDRVSRDPYFSIKKAGDRYYHWSRDILSQNGHLYLALYKGEAVGFGLNMTNDGKQYDACLGGVFPEFINKGLGFLALHTNIMSIIIQGGTRITTAVSSNNSAILRLHLLFGFEIQSMNYILIKHIEG